jgi:hypothetical protein
MCLAALAGCHDDHTPAIELAVGHDGQSLDVGLPTGRTGDMEQDRPRVVGSQLLFDLR